MVIGYFKTMSLLKRRRRDYHGVHVDPARLRKQERASKFRRFLNTIYAIIILGTLIWIVYFVLYSPIFKIKNITIVGNEEIFQDDIKRQICQVMEQKKYFLIPRDTFFTTPIDLLSRTLSETFILANLEISKEFPHDLKINLKEKLSNLNFCTENEEIKCYQINYRGEVTKRTGPNEPGSSPPTLFYRLPSLKKKEPVGETVTPVAATTTATTTTDIESQSVAQIPRIVVGKTKIPTEIVHFVLELLGVFGDKVGGIEIQDVEINNLDSSIIINTRQGYQIYFNRDEDMIKQIDNLNTLLAKEIKGEQDRLEYIDLRFGDRVYYK